MLLGGPTVAVSSWVRLNGYTRGLSLFSSYQSAACGTSVHCKNAVGEALDSSGWLAVGMAGTAKGLFVAGAVFDSTVADRFFESTYYDWSHVAFSFIERAVHVYVDGAAVGVGMLEADVPRMLRSENSIGGSLGTEPLPQYSRFAAADFRVYDRSRSSLEAAALHTNPSAACCVTAGLVDAFGVGSIDLTAEVMAAVGHPSAVTVRPEGIESNGTTADTNLKPCSVSESSAAVREVDICGDVTTIDDSVGVVSDGVGPYIRYQVHCPIARYCTTFLSWRAANSNYFVWLSIRSADCGLRLQGYRGGRYTLTFEEFDTEAAVDFLSVFDGSSDAAPLLGRFSGAELPSALTSLGMLTTSDYDTNLPEYR
eukprot:SAG22_NODE_31_length_27697_cov_7.384376_18_plen_368_part_00